MIRTLVVSGLALLIAPTTPVSVFATGNISLYFDRELTQEWAECPGAPPGSVLDTLYMAIGGFSSPVEGIECSVVFPPEVLWIIDITSDRGLAIGSTYNGISMAFFEPIDASVPTVIQEIVIQWLCDGCIPDNSVPIEIAAHPATGSLRAVTSDLTFEDVVGQAAWVCYPYVGDSQPPISTTLGKVRAASPLSEQCVLVCPAGDGGTVLPGDPPGVHHDVDLDGNRMVDLVDFSLFIPAYRGEFNADMDYYCSGNLDLIDFVLFTRHYLHTGTVPAETSTWGEIKARFLD